MKEITIPQGTKSFDIFITLPNGEAVRLQYTAQGTGGLDIIFDKPVHVDCFKDDELNDAKAGQKVKQMIVAVETKKFSES